MKKEWSPLLLSILRIVVAFLFIQHGTSKWFAFPGPMMPGGGTVPAGSLLWFAAVIETIGGPFILLGLFTRPVALVLAGEMAVAYFLMHAGNGFWPLLNHGEAAVFFCFTFLYFSATGAGPWSLDALLARRRASTAPVL